MRTSGVRRKRLDTHRRHVSPVARPDQGKLRAVHEFAVLESRRLSRIQGRQSRALPARACVTFHATGFAAHPDDAERGAESFPLSPPQRRLPAAHLSPGSVPRRWGKRRVWRLDSLRAPQANLVLLDDVPNRSNNVSPFPTRRRVMLSRHLSRMVAIDVSVCSICGGAVKIIACIEVRWWSRRS